MPASSNETAPLLDLVTDLVDDRAQRRQLEMLALQIGEAEIRRLHPAHRAFDVPTNEGQFGLKISVAPPLPSGVHQPCRPDVPIA